MNAAALFSGGKDSLYATYLAEKQGVTVNHLITLLPTLPQPSPHAKNIEALKLIAKSTGKHLTIVDFRKENAFIETLENLEVDALVAGDIYVEPHRRGLEDVCAKTGLKLHEPLYGRDTSELFHEIFNSGFTALITGVNLEVMGKEFLGSVINKDASADFLSKIGTVDPLGENGEFHTIVLECPLYPKSFKVKSMEKYVEKGMAYLVVSIAQQ
jgi:diphthine-ammonia ligase